MIWTHGIKGSDIEAFVSRGCRVDHGSSDLYSRRLFILIAVGASICLSALWASSNGAPLAGPIAAAALVHLFLFAVLSQMTAPGASLLVGFLIVQSVSLVILPIADLTMGPPRLPQAVPGTCDQMERIIWGGSLFSLVFSVSWLATSRAADRTVHPLRAPLSMGVLTLILGCVGVGLRFSGGPLDVGAQSDGLWNVTRAGGGWRDLLAGLLVPLLTPGMLIVSRRWVKGHSFVPLIPAWLGVIAVLLSFMLNRATMMIAIGAALLLWHLRIQKIGTSVWVFLGTVAALSFMAIGEFRASLLGAWDPYRSDSFFGELVRQAQIYGQSPAFVAGVVQRSDEGFGVQSLLASLLGPLPGIGASVRDASGTALLNYSIYGVGSDVRDFILPSWIELLLSFGVAGLIAGAALLGYAAKRCVLILQGTASPLSAFAASVGLLWLSLAGVVSLSVLVQSFLYQALPAAVLSTLYFTSQRRGSCP